MGLMDKVKAQAEVGLLHDLGAAVYADHVGRGGDQTAADAERIVGELQAYEAEFGPLVP